MRVRGRQSANPWASQDGKGIRPGSQSKRSQRVDATGQSIGSEVRSVMDRVRAAVDAEDARRARLQSAGRAPAASPPRLNRPSFAPAPRGGDVEMRARLERERGELRVEMQRRILELTQEREEKLRVCLEAQGRMREKIRALQDLYAESEKSIEIMKKAYDLEIDKVRTECSQRLDVLDAGSSSAV